MIPRDLNSYYWTNFDRLCSMVVKKDVLLHMRYYFCYYNFISWVLILTLIFPVQGRVKGIKVSSWLFKIINKNITIPFLVWKLGINLNPIYMNWYFHQIPVFEFEGHVHFLNYLIFFFFRGHTTFNYVGLFQNVRHPYFCFYIIWENGCKIMNWKDDWQRGIWFLNILLLKWWWFMHLFYYYIKWHCDFECEKVYIVGHYQFLHWLYQFSTIVGGFLCVFW